MVSLWVFMGVMDVYGFLSAYGCFWVSMGIYGCPWFYIGVYGCL